MTNKEEFIDLFTEKAQYYCDEAYISKTINQIWELPKEYRAKLKPKITFFLNCKSEKLCRKVFGEIAGLVNDYHFSALYDWERGLEKHQL